MGDHPFRPSNGTEGEYFYSEWCARCIHERSVRGSNWEDYENACEIFTNTLVYDEDDPNYPKEWLINDEGEARCTAFVLDEGQPLPESRCRFTLDLFEQGDANV